MSPLLRTLAVATFLLVFASVLVGAHWYVAERLVLAPGLAAPWRGLALWLIAALGSTLVLQPIAERTLRPPLARLVAWPASLWMGFLFLLVVLLVASDALLWLGGHAAQAATRAGGGGAGRAGERAAAVVSLALVLGALAVRGALRAPRLRRLRLELPGWPPALDGFRIVQLSDLHIGSILGRAFAARLVSRVNALAPDLVAVTGDLVDGGVRQLADEVAPLAGLRARHGVYFVTGNHDHYSGARSWVEHVRSLGMRPLRNQRVAIEARGAVFDLVGVDDHRGDVMGGEGGEDLERALGGRDTGRPAILLAHDPTTFKAASSRGIALQLSGHTHGGQIWPFRYLVRAAVPFVAGLYRRGGATLYVSRGTGFWGPPMRLFAPAEITELTLVGARPAAGTAAEAPAAAEAAA